MIIYFSIDVSKLSALKLKDQARTNCHGNNRDGAAIPANHSHTLLYKVLTHSGIFIKSRPFGGTGLTELGEDTPEAT